MSVSGLIHAEQLLADLRVLCAVPGTAARPQELGAVALEAALLMRAAGLEVQRLDTDGPPVILGYRAGRTPATLLLYHHYDVAPSGPWRSWNHEPFQLAERDGLLFGRGVAVGKGPLVAHLSGLRALLADAGGLPCGVIVVAEGRGHSGSAGLESVRRHLPQPVDFCLASSGEYSIEGVPFCYSGVKGLLQMQLSTRNAGQALPAGLSASVRNPLWRLIWALSSIKTEDEALQIEGVEGEIEPLGRDESLSLRNARLDEQRRLEAWQLDSFLFDMQGAGLLRTEATLPSCNISQLSSDPGGDFLGIPMSASARLDFQLVPYQQPATIAELVREHLARLGFGDIAAEALPGGYCAARTLVGDHFVQLAAAAGAEVFGASLTALPMGYFALPLALLVDRPTSVASIGCAGVDTGSVGANESVALASLIRHANLLMVLLRRVAAAAT